MQHTRRTAISKLGLGAGLILVSAVTVGSAGGILTDIGRATGVINKERAEMLDDLHDQFKRSNPDYEVGKRI
jgi:hypothetical protein